MWVCECVYKYKLPCGTDAMMLSHFNHEYFVESLWKVKRERAIERNTVSTMQDRDYKSATIVKHVV